MPTLETSTLTSLVTRKTRKERITALRQRERSSRFDRDNSVGPRMLPARFFWPTIFPFLYCRRHFFPLSLSSTAKERRGQGKKNQKSARTIPGSLVSLRFSKIRLLYTLAAVVGRGLAPLSANISVSRLLRTCFSQHVDGSKKKKIKSLLLGMPKSASLNARFSVESFYICSSRKWTTKNNS